MCAKGHWLSLWLYSKWFTYIHLHFKGIWVKYWGSFSLHMQHHYKTVFLSVITVNNWFKKARKDGMFWSTNFPSKFWLELWQILMKNDFYTYFCNTFSYRTTCKSALLLSMVWFKFSRDKQSTLTFGDRGGDTFNEDKLYNFRKLLRFSLRCIS